MSQHPIAIERIASGIKITWSEGAASEYSARQLRDACPCALCKEKQGTDSGAASRSTSGTFSMPILSRQEIQPLEIVSMIPVGNYAYNIHFSDGHNAGIYPFDLLVSLLP